MDSRLCGNDEITYGTFNIRQWYVFYAQASSIGQQPVSQLNQQSVIVKQPVSQLIQIPWGHNLKIIAKCKSIDEALYYVQQTQVNGWSRSVLIHQIESGLWQREGKAINNFESTLPAFRHRHSRVGGNPLAPLLNYE